jgi:S-adenosylmethionine synthetase
MFEIEAEFGEIVVILDEVYSEMHKFKFMGFRIESKKSLRVLSALVDSIAANLAPLLKQMQQQQQEAIKIAQTIPGK